MYLSHNFSAVLAVTSIWSLAGIGFASANQFLDDYGKVHVLFNEPRIVCSATTAISLRHLGMDDSWLVATWGSAFNRRSNLYSGEESEYYTMDAQAEDLEFLRSRPSFSHPACLDPSKGNPGDCSENSIDKVRAIQDSAVNLIIDLTNYHDDFVANVSSILSAPLVRIDTAFDGSVNCLPDPEDPVNYLGTVNENCYRRSYIDVVNRLYDLADWMGVDTSHDRHLLCEASKKLTKAAEYAQEQGIRFAGASIQETSEFIPDSKYTCFMTNPLQFSTIRTMEELGLPILWPGKCTSTSCSFFGQVPVSYETLSPAVFFPNCPEGNIEPECAASNPLYPVDFWLLEGQGYQQLEDDPDSLKSAFPDKALLSGQYMAFPFDSFVYSHKSISGWMNKFADRIHKAKRIHPKTACVDMHVTSMEHLQFDDHSLPEGGSYACYDSIYHNTEYTTCPRVIGGDSGLSPGAVAGIAIGAVAGGAIVAVLVMKFVLGYRTGIDRKFMQEHQDEQKNTPDEASNTGSIQMSSVGNQPTTEVQA